MSANGNAEFQRLVSLYEANSNNFQKAFGITIGFGLFISLTVLLPYYLNIYESEQNRSLMIIKNGTIQEMNYTYNHLNSSAQALNKSIGNLKDNIDTTRVKMDARIKEVNSSLSDADKLLTNITDADIYNELTSKLNETKYQENKTIESYKIILGSLDESIKMYEKKYSEKVANLGITKKVIDNSWSNITEAIKNRDTLEGNLNNLTERWKEIQSPFGNLPMGFTNLMAIFPLALSVGFVLCGNWLKESIRLRSYIHATHLSDNLPKLASLWVEPTQKRAVQFLQFLLFSIPFVIFLISVLMIIYAWEHAPIPPFASGGEVNQIVYYAMYGVCFGLFGYGFCRVVYEVRMYEESKKSWIPGKNWG